jgi:hypothetical protein
MLFIVDVPNDEGRITQPIPSNDVASLPSAPADAYTPFDAYDTERMSELPKLEFP